MKRLGFSNLQGGMIVEVVNEQGQQRLMVEEVDVPSPTQQGSDFHYTVRALVFRPFTREGKDYKPSTTTKYTYIEGFPNFSDMPPTDCELLGFYKVVYQVDADRKYGEDEKTPEDILTEALENISPEKLSRILSTLQSATKDKK